MPLPKRLVSEPVPYWRSECGRATVYLGDNRLVMPQLAETQFHAVVCDPPYELDFMGRKWDSTGIAYDVSVWEKVLRLCWPGAHLLSFGGTRTSHRITCAIEDAGFEVRDEIMWLYGSGFPKSLDVSKAIDKEAGASQYRQVTRSYECAIGGTAYNAGNDQWRGTITLSEGATEEAKRWHGWGTGLKPAYEPIVVARKPLAGTVAQNVLANGCGGLNIDGCRVGVDGGCAHEDGTGGYDAGTVSAEGGHLNSCRSPQRDGLGRWPANVVLSHHPECRMVGTRASRDKSFQTVSTGEVVSDNRAMSRGNYGRVVVASAHRPDEEVWECHPDCPTQAFPRGTERFFYTSKAGDDDRPHGKGAKAHPTVKPLNLMRYLVRLVAARGATVFDPFLGSGSTGCAAVEEGMWFVGIEQSQEYADIAVGRLKLSLARAPEGRRLETGEVVKRAGVGRPPPERLD